METELLLNMLKLQQLQIEILHEEIQELKEKSKDKK